MSVIRQKGRALAVAVEVRPACPVIAKRAAEYCQLRRLGREHPALPGRNRLARVEGEAAHVPEDARVPTLVPGVEGTCRILDDQKFMAARDFQDRIHVGEQAE
jgi:hypothetical protein